MSETGQFGFYDKDDDALRAEYQRDKQDIANANSGGGVPLLYLKKGITQVRILPPYSSKGKWFREIKEVYIPQEGSITSPSTFGDPCPFEEEGKRLYAEKTEESINAARSFRPRSVYFFNVICYSAPSGDKSVKDGVVVMKAPATVKRALLDLDQDAAGGWGDITNLEKGIDVRIERSGEGLKTEYRVKPIPTRSSIVDTVKKEGLDPSEVLQPFDLDPLFPPKSYEELQKTLENMKNPDDEPPIPPVTAKSFEEGIKQSKTPKAPVKSDGPEVPDLPSPPSE